MAELMKVVKTNSQKVQALADAAGGNGRLNKATVEHALDRMIKAAEEINRELDELLAKVRK